MSEYMVCVPISVIKATHKSGYFDLYGHYLGQGLSPREAYEAVEGALFRHGLPGRYASYESFRMCFGAHRKEKRNKVAG